MGGDRVITLTVPRETIEYIPVAVTLNGIATTTGVSFAVVADGSRPTSWTSATVLDNATYTLISGLAPGLYNVFAKVSAAPETPVVICGSLIVE
jgi:saccharopine dehydrogenase-like NADP-dependent oxidoreductase